MRISVLAYSAILLITALLTTAVQAQQADQQPPQSTIDSGFEWYSLSEAQNLAAMNSKKILLFGYAEWCGYCRKMRRESFPDPAVLAALEKYYYPVQLNGQSEETVEFSGVQMQSYELAQFLQLSSYPTHYFIDAEGNLLGRQPGFIEADIYALLLEFIGSNSHETMGFEEFVNSREGE